jgi:hypothetical protein
MVQGPSLNVKVALREIKYSEKSVVMEYTTWHVDKTSKQTNKDNVPELDPQAGGHSTDNQGALHPPTHVAFADGASSLFLPIHALRQSH